MIMQCAIFGFLAAGPVGVLITKSRISGLLLIWLINGLMTYYTYFKDYAGDKQAGKRTLVVKYGLNSSRIIGLLFSFIPSIFFVFIYTNNLIIARANNVFMLLMALKLKSQLLLMAVFASLMSF